MKKSLFLAALFTALFIGVVSCSDDSENIIDDGEEPQWFPTYTIVGKLTYNKDSNCYFFAIDKISDKLVNDTLICHIHNEPDGRIETIRVDTSHVIETNIYELIGLDISVFAGPQSIQKIEDVYTLLITDRITKLTESKSTSGEYIVDGEPEIFPEAYSTVPLSRTTYNLSGHYEVVNIYIHVIRKTNGVGENKEKVETQILDHLKAAYPESSTHIRFNIIGSEYIDYLTDYMVQNLDIKNNATERNKIFAMNPHAYAIDIYYLSSWEKMYGEKNDQLLLGKANGIPSTSLILSPKYTIWDRFTPAHEVGHCLGLFHTHQDTENIKTNPNAKNAELVNGSNSTKAGDLLSDTPADPNAWINGKYNSSLQLRDANGDFYSPDRENLMSYAHNDETQKVTSQQIERMHNFLSNNATISKMASNRGIGLVGTPLGGAGNQHFTEKSRTLTFPAVADDEEVTWTIYQRSDYGYSTSHANPSVTTKKGHSITIERYGIADCYEIYATTTTPYGAERRAEWKASAGVPSPAVGTLNWTAKGGSLMGSFPGYNPTITVFHDLDLSFNYTDFANPAYRSGMTYRVYTAYGGMYETSMDVVLSDMECSGGYIDVQVVDPCCGASSSMFRINCELRWDVYSLDIKDGQLAIDVKPATTQAATAEKASAKRDLTIKSIKLTTPEGRQLVGRTLDTPQRKMSLSTAGMPKGQYQIEITDVEGNVHKARFGI